jgi:outer membrane immunogenic protein
MKFRHLVTGLVSALALSAASQSASAADMGVRARPAPVPAMVQQFNWTGFYLGVHGGYGSGSTDNNIVGLNSPDPTGWFAGGQLGYNWQAPGSPWVFGVEVDSAWANIEDTATTVGAIRLKSDVDYFGTARGRVGYAWDRTLLYATGGLAWADNNVHVSLAPFGTASDSQTHIGYAVGGGLEYAFAPQWSAKVEYLYLGLGDQTYFGAPGLNVDLDVHTVKVGLNYRWGGM